MDFISSIYFPNELLVSLLLLCCCTHPKVMTRMAKKCSTDHRSIQKRNTTYRIHNLVNFTLMPCMYLGFFARPHIKFSALQCEIVSGFLVGWKISCAMCNSCCAVFWSRNFGSISYSRCVRARVSWLMKNKVVYLVLKSWTEPFFGRSGWAFEIAGRSLNP